MTYASFAPIGLYFCGKKDFDDDFVDMLGAKSAALTHGHELSYIPAAALTHIIRAIVEKGMTPKKAVSDSVVKINLLFPNSAYMRVFSALIQKALALAESDMDNLTAIHLLGEGWVAEETLAIAVYCALKYHDDFDKAIRTAVNHNGAAIPPELSLGISSARISGMKRSRRNTKRTLSFGI